MELTKERMLEIAKKQKKCDFCFDAEPCANCKNKINITLEELWEYHNKVIDLLEADANGQLVVLPCKVKNTVRRNEK